MPSSDHDDFEVVAVKGPDARPAPMPRRSARTALPAIPKVPSPSRENFSDAAESNSAATKRGPSSATGKRKRTSASRSESAEHDELEAGPKRRYKAPSATPKAKREPKPKAKKEPKPKKISKAAMERAKLQELRDDEYFGKLDEATIKRIAKAHLQRLYLIHRFRNANHLKEEFDVYGSSGNVYKVTLARNVHCSCIDFGIQRKPCKHVLFVYIKVLRLQGHLPVYSRIRLTDAELETIFAEARNDPVAEAMAKPGLRRAWETAVGYKGEAADTAASSSNEESASQPSGKRLIPEEGDVCGVCYEDLEPGSTEGLEFCSTSCGRPLHTDCLDAWFNSRGFAKTCIWCRAPWHGASTVEADRRQDPYADGYGIGIGRRGAVVDNNGYQLNLFGAAEVEPAAADTAGWE